MAVHVRAERDAQQLLDRLDVTGIPVDPIRIARAFGIEVWTSDLEPDVAGALVVTRHGDAPQVYINASDHARRQRFTVAHEVGHFFDRALKGKAGEPLDFVDYRDDLSSQGTDPAEMYANGFAAALLMPAAHVREYWPECLDADTLASKFEVSPAAMRHRLRNLGLQ